MDNLDFLIVPVFGIAAIAVLIGIGRGLLHDIWGIGPEPQIRLGDYMPDQVEPVSRSTRLLVGYPLLFVLAMVSGAIAWGQYNGFSLLGSFDAFLRATFQ